MLASQTSPLQIKPGDFKYFQEMILQLAGISLSDAKQELVQSRLRSRISLLGLKDFTDYRKHLQALPTEDSEWQSFINLLTTNKTDWFREPEHFDVLIQDFLPRWRTLKKNKLSVWCAASSTGEEPYTLALLLDEALKGTGIQFEILATDIDTNVLNTAKNGVYNRDRLVQIPEKYHRPYFDFGTQEIANWVRVKKSLKQHLRFETFNLSQNPFPWKEQFDVIFCRNVLIYFSAEMTRAVTENAFRAGTKDSLLFIAHSESLQNFKTSWTYMSPSVYSKGNLFHGR